MFLFFCFLKRKKVLHYSWGLNWCTDACLNGIVTAAWAALSKCVRMHVGGLGIHSHNNESSMAHLTISEAAMTPYLAERVLLLNIKGGKTRKKKKKKARSWTEMNDAIWDLRGFILDVLYLFGLEENTLMEWNCFYPDCGFTLCLVWHSWDYAKVVRTIHCRFHLRRLQPNRSLVGLQPAGSQLESQWKSIISFPAASA